MGNVVSTDLFGCVAKGRRIIKARRAVRARWIAGSTRWAWHPSIRTFHRLGVNMMRSMSRRIIPVVLACLGLFLTQTAGWAHPAAQTNTNAVTVPAGTSLLVRMIDTVDSKKNKIGDIFHGSLEDPLVVGTTVLAPKGADVYGKLAQAKSAGKISGSSDLTLELTGVRINGVIQPVTSTDYDVKGKSRGKQSAERIGGGAAVGAIIGAIAGGGKGAAIGAGVGGGAGTAVQVLTHGQQVRVPSETLLEFRLQQPLTVTAPAANPSSNPQ
jgi:hypothetical protein